MWWVQSNVAGEVKYEAQEKTVLNNISSQYFQFAPFNYAPQNPSIWVSKSKFFNSREYEYRLDVIRFYNP